MIKKLNLAGTWDFAMDPEKKGIDEHIYSKEFSDNIPLPGTISMAQKGTPSDVKETGFLTDPYLFEGSTLTKPILTKILFYIWSVPV